ncbi:hypothetical protein [Sporosarcina globispora]|nr:hypothetical protein [Sporosarcina globispora]
MAKKPNPILQKAREEAYNKGFRKVMNNRYKTEWVIKGRILISG